MESCMTSRSHAVARDLYVPLIVGIFALLGTIAGVLLANAHNTKLAERQIVIEFEGKIYEKRIELIDRTANIFGKSPGLQDVWSQYIEKTTVEQSKQSPIELAEKLSEAQGEFQSVVFLSQAYFGPRTRSALADLSASSGPWWNKPKDKQDALLASMISEVTFGMTILPASQTESP